MIMGFSNLLTNFAACSPKGLGGLIPTWYKYLPVDPTDTSRACAVKFVFPTDIPLIALALVDILLRVSVFVAIGFVIYGGIQFVISQGEPDKVAGAKKTILNAVVGLVIAMIATALVGFIGTRLGA